MQAQALAVLLEPAAQGRPLADQDLVRDLGGAVAERDAAARRRSRSSRTRTTSSGDVLGYELGDRHTRRRVSSMPSPSSVSRRKTLRSERRCSSGQRRRPGRRPYCATAEVDAAAVAVAVDGERAAVASLPGRAQRVREQRQRAGLAGDVARARASTRPGSSRSPARRAGSVMARAQLVVAHRAEQHLVRGDRARELGWRAQLAVEVGAHADRDRPSGARSSASMNARAALGVVAQREQLLELVDDDERPASASTRGRLAPGVHEPRRAASSGDLAGATGATRRRAAARTCRCPTRRRRASSRPGASRSMTAPTTSSRPKKKRAVVRRRTPAGRGTGTRSQASGVPTPGPATAWMRSAAPRRRAGGGGRDRRASSPPEGARRRAPPSSRDRRISPTVGLAADPRREVDASGRSSRRRAVRPRRCGCPKRTAIAQSVGHCSAPSARVAAIAASTAPDADSKTETVASPSPMDLRKRPPCASTAAAMSSSWRTSARHRAGSRSHSARGALDVRAGRTSSRRSEASPPSRRAAARRARRASPGGAPDRSPGQADRGLELLGLRGVDALPAPAAARRWGAGQQRERRRGQRVDVARPRRRARRRRARGRGSPACPSGARASAASRTARSRRA